MAERIEITRRPDIRERNRRQRRLAKPSGEREPEVDVFFAHSDLLEDGLLAPAAECLGRNMHLEVVGERVEVVTHTVGRCRGNRNGWARWDSNPHASD
jgi:hypothetical protein